jgi:hypothetical protein
MSSRYQIVIDTPDPNELARFWAEALDYLIEDHSPVLRRMIDDGDIAADRVTEEGERLVWLDWAAIREPDAPTKGDTGIGTGDRLIFQRVAEPKISKNRLHLDVNVGAKRREAEVARLEELGAQRLYDGKLGSELWTTMADPHGNEFCVQ